MNKEIVFGEKTKMTDKTRTKIKTIFATIQNKMVRLYERWQDEREYENFDVYVEIVKNIINKMRFDDVTFIKLTKRPFSAICKVDDYEVHIIVTANQYKWKARKS